MTGFSARVVPVLVLLLAGRAAAQTQRFPAFDPERIFVLGDADLDGRLSLEEYRDFLRSSPRMRDAAATIEPMFRRLDADRDGFLSLSEYRKSFPQRPGGAAARPDAPNGEAAGRGHPPSAAITPEQEEFFEAKIRPVLATQCGKCHASTAEKLRGGLRLDSREALRLGGDSGPAIVPGNPDESLLIRAIRYRDDELRMPPKAKLPDAVVADFEAWVKMGAPDPRTGPTGVAARPSIDLAKGREFWSFRPPKKSAPPAVKRADWPRGDIDRFLLAALESRGLAPVADADRPRLLRRVTFDLIGLPPTPEELDAFLRDDSPDAFGKVVDRLLASPRFGERWGRHWLDVARFAESSGKTNFTYPQAWRYRDWAIASFNADKPYDQFVREQIAGDLLPADDDRKRADQIIATGFLALGSKAHDAENRGQFVLDVVDEQIEATTRAFLGLTVACARCHDHKMDPISAARLLRALGHLPQHPDLLGHAGGRLPELQRVAADRAASRRGRALGSPLAHGRAAGRDGRAPRRPGPRTRLYPPGRGESGPAPAGQLDARDAPLSPADRPARRPAPHVRDGSPRARRGRR